MFQPSVVSRTAGTPVGAVFKTGYPVIVIYKSETNNAGYPFLMFTTSGVLYSN